MILLRHGQSEFNLHFSVSRRDPGIVDPQLTELGYRQALDAAEALARAGIARIVVSPYTRALQTAAPIAAALGVPVVVDTIVRERYAYVCDVGTVRSALERDWPDRDFSAIEERWWPVEEEPEHGIRDRARRFREAMAARDDWSDALVVSHWGFIRALTGVTVGNGEWLRCDPGAPMPVI